MLLAETSKAVVDIDRRLDDRASFMKSETMQRRLAIAHSAPAAMVSWPDIWRQFAG